MEGDRLHLVQNIYNFHFNPLPPHGGRRSLPQCPIVCVHISIHSLRMEGDRGYFEILFILCISIHSLRMEGDGFLKGRDNHGTHFNPLPPHGGRHGWFMAFGRSSQFQSTPSAWRETPVIHNKFFTDAAFQSTPSAWRETQITMTHIPTRRFQSTPSAWRETVRFRRRIPNCSISIHSLRMEGDFVVFKTFY